MMVNHWLKHRLVGGFNQPLWKICVRQWEGWHRISMKWNILHSWSKPPTSNEKAIGTLCQVWQDEGNPIRLTWPWNKCFNIVHSSGEMKKTFQWPEIRPRLLSLGWVNYSLNTVFFFICYIYLAKWNVWGPCSGIKLWTRRIIPL